MRLRSLCVFLSLSAPVLFPAGVLAQGGRALDSSRILPVPGVKHAGTYYVATGAWSRGRTSPARGAYDVIYDNSCFAPWYTAIEQYRLVDDGRIPSTSSPQIDQGPLGSGNFEQTSLVGTSDAYQVNWYQISYCTGVLPPVTMENSFWTCYASCEDATRPGMSPVATFQISGLPGAPSAGSIGCWVVSIDLLGASQGFTLSADCDGVWDGTPQLDNFGYSFFQVTPDPLAISGPFLAGDPDGVLGQGPAGTGCCVGCNTIFWAGANVPGTCGEGSGLNNSNFFEFDNHLGSSTFAYNGCYWFGCAPFSPSCARADIYMEIRGEDAAAPAEPGTAYCCADLGGCNTCPCGNPSDGSIGCAGCANGTFASGARLWGSGEASVTRDTLVLRGEHGTPGNFGLFFQGQGNLDCTGNLLGDGLRCAGGAVKRIQVRPSNAAGSANTSDMITARSASLGDVISPGSTRYYQWWYRDTNNPPCGTGVNDSNTSNGYEILWTL